MDEFVENVSLVMFELSKNESDRRGSLSTHMWQKNSSLDCSRRRNSGSVTSGFVHFLLIHLSQKSHCNASWLLFTGLEQPMQGNLIGPGLREMSPISIRAKTR